MQLKMQKMIHISAEKIVEDKMIFHEDVVIGVAASGNTPFM